jgi:cobalt-zinc-cadmium efflux system membrane fusion protein
MNFQFANSLRLDLRRPRPARKLTRGAWALGAISLAALTACSSDAARPTGTMTSYSADQGDKAGLFTLPAEQMSHIQIVKVTAGPLKRDLRLPGAVAYNAFQTTPVISQIGGPISRIVVLPGESVHPSQTMLYVTSPDFSAQSAAYLKARSASDLAEKNYIRANDLYDHHAIAERDLQQAESDRNQAQADLQASAAGLHILGISDPESLVGHALSPEIPLQAPIAGEVVERLCSPGQLLQAGTTQCFTISDMSSVWVLVNVYQKDLADVRVGDDVTVQTDSYSDVFRGKISYIAPSLDATTRTVQARIITSNPGQKLKKDMYVTAVVQAGTISDALTVPDAAVMRDTENMPFVYVQTGTNQFARRIVKLGFGEQGRTQITDGLKAGEQVVGDGGVYLQFQNSLQQQ